MTLSPFFIVFRKIIPCSKIFNLNQNWRKMNISLFPKRNHLLSLDRLDTSVISSVVWAHNEEEPRCNFWKSLNEFDPCSKSTYDSNNKSIVCLVTKVRSRKGKCITDLCVKPTYPHQKLNYLSAHWYHIKTSVVFNKTLRVSRLFSSEKDFENHEEEMKLWFRKRTYPDDLI